jgi:large subunit ribosomal protein L32e
LEDVLVFNLKDIEKIDPETQAVRISSNVGAKKRIEIKKKAGELGLKVLN